MSCRAAFDNAYYCKSPGGQFVNVYRYGTYRECKDQWSQFWFCMRVRTKPEEVKRALIRDWYEKREERYVEGKSSEDVWDQRRERVEVAFNVPLDGVELSDTRHKRT